MSGMDQGSDHDRESMGLGDMPGMMTDGAMKKLMGASGADFDRMFLTMMTEQHRGDRDSQDGAGGREERRRYCASEKDRGRPNS